jgi:hypothetical protein
MHVQMRGRHVPMSGRGVLLLDKVKQSWEKIRRSGGSIGSNKMVGIISHSQAPVGTQSLGGELLNSLSFGRNVKGRGGHQRENIKFIF